jgi:hypothetical protein
MPPTPACLWWPVRRSLLGRQLKHHTLVVHVSETTLAVEPPETDTMVVRRTTDKAVRSIEGQRPRTAYTSVSQAK